MLERVRLTTLACLLWLIGCLSGFSAELTAEAPELVIVCPDRFLPALQPYLLWRHQQGVLATVVPSGCSAAEVQKNILSVAGFGQTRFVFLIGDCVIGRSDGNCHAESEVPTWYPSSSVAVKWGSTPDLADDSRYGDLTGDGLPNAAVGRIPVKQPEELVAYLRRVRAYEESADFGTWRRDIILTAGVGGFGMLADAAIQTVTRNLITTALPTFAKTHVTYAGENSPFNPGADCFHDAVLDRYCQGAAFWVYAGHGNITELDRVPRGPHGRAVLSNQDLHKLQLPQGRLPIALLLACYTGAFDATEDCLAERLVLCEHGPVAVIAGSRVTLPYGNVAIASGLIQAIFEEENAERLGDAWLAALTELVTESDSDKALSQRRGAIDALAGLLSPTKSDLPGERREHLGLYNLLGDPAIGLRRPLRFPLETRSQTVAGTKVTVKTASPITGQLTISLQRTPGSHVQGETPLDCYRCANEIETTLLSRQVQAGQQLTVAVPIPPQHAGVMHLVAHIKNADRFAVGVSRIMVVQANPNAD